MTDPKRPVPPPPDGLGVPQEPAPVKVVGSTLAFGPPLAAIPAIPQPKGPPPPPASPPPANKPIEAPEPKPVAKIQVTGGLLGKILVDNKLLTIEQRDHCVRLLGEPGCTVKFGEAAVKLGYITEQILDRALKAQQKYIKGVHKEQSKMIPLPEEVAKVQSTARTGSKQMMNWLISALRHGASDLHIMTGQPLVLRHMGRLIKSKDPPLDIEAARSVLFSVLDDDEIEQYETRHSLVKCFDLNGGGRVRANIFRHQTGINGAFRLIPEQAPSLVSLNLPPSLAKFTTYAQGLVLITGPIGCGKTTTMAALVDIINQERNCHIITIEDPAEFIHKCNQSLITQREVGLHTGSYSAALRASLREDPDVIVVGEMRDLETARLTVTAAETGHLVFATLHTENAVRSINRVLDLFPPDEQNQVRMVISESLRGVISQRLVPRADVPGRIPVVELLFFTPAMRNLIRDQKIYQLKNAIQISRDLGNQTVADHARELFEKRLISEKTHEWLCAREG